MFREVDDLLSLAHKIRPHLPQSAIVHNNLILHARGHARLYHFYVLSNHPEAHVVLYKTKEGQHTVGVHCLESEAGLLLRTLRVTTLLDWNATLRFYHVPDFLVGGLQALAKELTTHPLDIVHCSTFTYYSQPQQEEIWCSPGLRVCRLGEAGVLRMHEKWQYSSSIPVDEFVHLAKRGPTAAIYPDDDQTQAYEVDIRDLPPASVDTMPLAWITMMQYGALGLLYTEENHRRRGFGGMVTEVCARYSVGDGYIPQVAIGDHLSAAQMLFSSLPGWTSTRSVAWMKQIIDEHGQRKQSATWC